MSERTGDSDPSTTRARVTFVYPSNSCVAFQYCKFFGTCDAVVVSMTHNIFSPEGGPVSIGRLLSVNPSFVVCLDGQYCASDLVLSGVVLPRLCFDITTDSRRVAHCNRVRFCPQEAGYFPAPIALKVGATLKLKDRTRFFKQYTDTVKRALKGVDADNVNGLIVEEVEVTRRFLRDQRVRDQGLLDLITNSSPWAKEAVERHTAQTPAIAPAQAQAPAKLQVVVPQPVVQRKDPALAIAVGLEGLTPLVRSDGRESPGGSRVVSGPLQTTLPETDQKALGKVSDEELSGARGPQQGAFWDMSKTPPQLENGGGVMAYPRLSTLRFTNKLNLIVESGSIIPAIRNRPISKARRVPANIVPETQRYLTALGRDVMEHFVKIMPYHGICEVGGDGNGAISRPDGTLVPQSGPMSLRYPVDPGYENLLDSNELKTVSHLLLYVHYQNFWSRGCAWMAVQALMKHRWRQGLQTYVLVHALTVGGLVASHGGVQYDFSRPFNEPLKAFGRVVKKAEGDGDWYEKYEVDHHYWDYTRRRWLGDNHTGKEVEETVSVDGRLLKRKDFHVEGCKHAVLATLGAEDLIFVGSSPMVVGRDLHPVDVPIRDRILSRPVNQVVKLVGGAVGVDGEKAVTRIRSRYVPLVTELKVAMAALKPLPQRKEVKMPLEMAVFPSFLKPSASGPPPLPDGDKDGDGEGWVPGPATDDSDANEVHTVSLLGSLSCLGDLSPKLKFVGAGLAGLYASSSMQVLQGIMQQHSTILPARVAMPVIATVVQEYSSGREHRLHMANAHGCRSVVQDYTGDPIKQIALNIALPPFILHLHAVLSLHYREETYHLKRVQSEFLREFQWTHTPWWNPRKAIFAVSHNWGRMTEQLTDPTPLAIPTAIDHVPSVCRGFMPMQYPSGLVFLPAKDRDWFVGAVWSASKILSKKARDGVGIAAVMLTDPAKLRGFCCDGTCTNKVRTQALGVTLDIRPVLSSACAHEQLRGFFERQAVSLNVVPTIAAGELVTLFRRALAGQFPGLSDCVVPDGVSKVLSQCQIVTEHIVPTGGDFVDALPELSVPDWTLVTGSKCKKTFLEHDEFNNAYPIPQHKVSVRVNIKREYIGTDGPGQDPITKPPRVISDRNKEMKIRQIPFMRPLSKLVAQLFPFIGVYKTRYDICRELTQHATKIPQMASLTGDYSRQDAHTTADMKLSVHECLRILLHLSLTTHDRKKMVDAFSETFRKSKKAVFTVGEFAFLLLGTVGSGDMSTTLGNTLSSLLIFVHSVVKCNIDLKKAGRKPLEFSDMCANFTGDDSLVAMDFQSAVTLKPYWERSASGFGHKLVVDITYFTGPADTRASFCSKFYGLLPDGTVVASRKVGRALVRFPTTAVPGCPEDPFAPRNCNLLIAKLFSEYADGGFETPVLCGMLEGFSNRPDVVLRLANLRKHHYKGLKLDHSQTLWLISWASSTTMYGVDEDTTKHPHIREAAARSAAARMNLKMSVSDAIRCDFEDLTGVSPAEQVAMENILRARCSSRDNKQLIPSALVGRCVDKSLM